MSSCRARFPELSDCTHRSAGSCREYACRYSLITDQLLHPARVLARESGGGLASEHSTVARGVLYRAGVRRPWDHGGAADYLAAWDAEDREAVIDECVRQLPSTCAVEIATAGTPYGAGDPTGAHAPTTAHWIDASVARLLGIRRQGVSHAVLRVRARLARLADLLR